MNLSYSLSFIQPLTVLEHILLPLRGSVKVQLVQSVARAYDVEPLYKLTISHETLYEFHISLR